MSTVVQYNGSMIADISNTYVPYKTLLTANTYALDNIKFTNYNTDRTDLC